MKTIFFFIAILLTTAGIAQEVVNPEALDPSFNALTSFLLPAIGAAMFSLWTDTVKHIKAGQWDFWEFATTKILPFVTTTAIAVGVYYMIIYADFLIPFVEVLAEAELAETTAVGIFGFAARIVDDVIFKSKKEEV